LDDANDALEERELEIKELQDDHETANILSSSFKSPVKMRFPSDQDLSLQVRWLL
jgi:hypothetical protein